MQEQDVHAETATQAGTEHHAPAPSALGLDASGWVALAMALVILLLVWKKVPAVICGSLDRKISTIRAHLDDAARLRAEAEALKAEYEAKAKAATQEAAEIVENARTEANQIVAQAKTDAVDLIARRQRMAEDKIAAAERSAVAEVRAKAASAATSAARAVLAEGHDAGTDKGLIDRTIASIGSAARLN